MYSSGDPREGQGGRGTDIHPSAGCRGSFPLPDPFLTPSGSVGGGGTVSSSVVLFGLSSGFVWSAPSLGMGPREG